MEIRKSSSTVFNNVQNASTSETEKKTEKSLTKGIASSKDSFEVSSSSNQENSGTKQLGAAQEQEASKFNYKDFGNNGTSQNSRPTYEDAKNSGLAARLGHNKEASEADSKKELPNGVTVADIKNSPGQTEQSSAAVKDAQQKLNGGRTNYRESLDQELARRRQDFTMMGGSSAIDRAYSGPDPTATPKGKGEIPTGKDAVAYDKYSERSNKDGSVTHITDSAGTAEGGVTFVKHNEFTSRNRGNTIEEKETLYYPDNTKQETVTKSQTDINGVVVKSTSTVTTTFDNGESVINTSTSTKNKDGSTTTTTTETKKPAVGGNDTDQKSYGFDGTPGSSYGYMPLPPGVDDDRATGDIPDQIRNQINQTKPKKGGETELTDGGVTGNSADGTPIDNAFTRTGGVMGAVAQPTRAGEYVGGPSNGTVGSAIQNGGATDSLDGSSWTGTTHQDDPADVQFGPQTPVAGSVDSKKTDKDADSDSSLLDQILNRKNKKSE
jgi:hypothetical protein